MAPSLFSQPNSPSHCLARSPSAPAARVTELALTHGPTAGPIFTLPGTAAVVQGVGAQLSQYDLAVVASEAVGAAALVHVTASSSVDTRDDTFAKFASVSIVTSRAFAGILLHTLASVFALVTTDPSLTVTPLEARGTGATPRGSAGAPVHALGVTEGRVAVLAHVPFWADAALVHVAHPAVLAFLVTFWVGTMLCTLLPELESQWSPREWLPLQRLDQQPYSKGSHSRCISCALDVDRENLWLLRNPSVSGHGNHRGV